MVSEEGEESVGRSFPFGEQSTVIEGWLRLAGWAACQLDGADDGNHERWNGCVAVIAVADAAFACRVCQEELREGWKICGGGEVSY